MYATLYFLIGAVVAFFTLREARRRLDAGPVSEAPVEEWIAMSCLFLIISMVWLFFGTLFVLILAARQVSIWLARRG